MEQDSLKVVNNHDIDQSGIYSDLIQSDIDESAHQTAEALKQEYRILLNMPFSSFVNMICTDGSYHSIHTIGHNTGYEQGQFKTDAYINRRKQIEDSLFGSEAVINYGYLSTQLALDTHIEAPGYGNVTLVLKKEVIDRSYFTVGDSLDYKNIRAIQVKSSESEGVAMEDKPLLGFDDAAVSLEKLSLRQQLQTSSGVTDGYIEALISGGVEITDIEKVVLTEHKDQPGELKKFIDLFLENTKNIELVVRIPSNNPVSFDNIVLASKYPGVKFVFCVSYGNTLRSSPFYLLNKIKYFLRDEQSANYIVNVIISELENNNCNPEEAIDRINQIILPILKGTDGDVLNTLIIQYQESCLDYKAAIKRADELEVYFKKDWVSYNREESFPNNVEFVLTDYMG